VVGADIQIFSDSNSLSLLISSLYSGAIEKGSVCPVVHIEALRQSMILARN
jgi:hypothetical protein